MIDSIKTTSMENDQAKEMYYDLRYTIITKFVTKQCISISNIDKGELPLDSEVTNSMDCR